MSELFSCNPNCTLANLTSYDYLAVLILLIAVILLVTYARVLAFKDYGYPESSLKWHIPKFIFIGLCLAFFTFPVVGSLFGHLGIKVYGKFIFPILLVASYGLWLVLTE